MRVSKEVKAVVLAGLTLVLPMKRVANAQDCASTASKMAGVAQSVGLGAQAQNIENAFGAMCANVPGSSMVIQTAVDSSMQMGKSSGAKEILSTFAGGCQEAVARTMDPLGADYQSSAKTLSAACAGKEPAVRYVLAQTMSIKALDDMMKGMDPDAPSQLSPALVGASMKQMDLK